MSRLSTINYMSIYSPHLWYSKGVSFQRILSEQRYCNGCGETPTQFRISDNACAMSLIHGYNLCEICFTDRYGRKLLYLEDDFDIILYDDFLDKIKQSLLLYLPKEIVNIIVKFAGFQCRYSLILEKLNLQ